MRLHQLMLTSGLLLQAIGSAAFQLPSRKTITTIATGFKPTLMLPSAPASQMLGLRSKLKKIDIIPRLRKYSASKIPKKKDNDVIPSKQIVALVTTCCLTGLIRPGPARAVTVFMDYVMDPMTLTYNTIPPPGMLSNGVPGIMFSMDSFKALSRKSFKFFASILVVGTLASWTYAGLVYCMAFLASRKNLSSMENGTPVYNAGDSIDFLLGAPYNAGDTMTVKDAKQFNQAKHVNWAEYSQGLFGPPSVRKEKAPKHLMTAEENAKLQKAILFFQDQKRKLHNHSTHVRSKIGSSAYLDTLTIDYLDTLPNAKRSTWAEYNQQLTESQAKQVKEEKVGDKLQIMKNLLTWDDYKHLVVELQDRKHEVKELKQEVEHLQLLLQLENSIHQAVPYQEPEPTPSKDEKFSNELKKLEWLSKNYDQTIEESLAHEDQLQDDYHLGSGIK